MQNIFPDKITLHSLKLRDGSTFNLLVDPSETYGHALARIGIASDEVASIVLPDSPIWYEPDHACATR